LSFIAPCKNPSLTYAHWQPVGLKGNRLQKRLAGSYFPAFLANRITIDLQNPQNLSSPSYFFASIFQVRQAARKTAIGSIRSQV
jgi:hypothetical protein